jgi:hypothetical protein
MHHIGPLMHPAPKLKYWSHDPCTNSISIGEPMHPAPLLMVHRTQQIDKKVRILNGQGGGLFGVQIIDENNFIFVLETSVENISSGSGSTEPHIRVSNTVVVYNF